jgi:hypothetical protein
MKQLIFGIASLNPAEDTDVHLLCFVVCCVGSILCDELITHSEESYRLCVWSRNFNNETTQARQKRSVSLPGRSRQVPTYKATTNSLADTTVVELSHLLNDEPLAKRDTPWGNLLKYWRCKAVTDTSLTRPTDRLKKNRFFTCATIWSRGCCFLPVGRFERYTSPKTCRHTGRASTLYRSGRDK